MPSECKDCGALHRLLGSRDVQIRSLQAQVAPARDAVSELELAHAELDNAGIPRLAPSGNLYTLTGRLKRLIERTR